MKESDLREQATIKVLLHGGPLHGTVVKVSTFTARMPGRTITFPGLDNAQYTVDAEQQFHYVKP